MSHRESVADTVLTGGAVYTVDAARSWAQAVAIRDGRIAAVGPDAEVARWIGPRTRVIPLQGRLLVPGFQDAHVHVPSGGPELVTTNTLLVPTRMYDDADRESD
ncbi:MAG TPA: hypothetical protein VMW49_03150 [Candidatus Dormibacteraeota bacterium]|nr:hypothetical protein [Candidatus Dormibacteraeota bacterium]